MIDTGLATTLLVGAMGLGGTWLGAYLNRKGAVETARQLVEVERQKYAQSRLWDAKKDAYMDIVAQFNTVSKEIASMSDRLFDPEIDPSHYMESKDYSDDATDLWRRVSKVQTTIDNNSLILSDDFLASCAAWYIEFTGYDEEAEPREVISVQGEATRRHIPELIKVAKAELEADPKAG